MKKVKEVNLVLDNNEYRQFADSKFYEKDTYPVSNGKFGSQNRSLSQHSVSASDATKITFGVLLIILGIGVGLLGFLAFLLIPEIGLIFIFLSMIIIFTGYLVLKGLMRIRSMIMAAINIIVVCFLIYLFGLIIVLSLIGGGM